jgi:ABC-type dipeptide/oligopeptide/nickel transport system ATPase subunit
MTRAGIVTVVGKPNAGKSTLLNRVVGQKLSITSPKPQTTRDRVVGIHSTDDVQMVIFDTPGLLNPRYTLQRAMRSAALQALADADVILALTDDATSAMRAAAEAVYAGKPLVTSDLPHLAALFPEAVHVHNDAGAIAAGVRTALTEQERLSRRAPRMRELQLERWEAQRRLLTRRLGLEDRAGAAGRDPGRLAA